MLLLPVSRLKKHFALAGTDQQGRQQRFDISARPKSKSEDARNHAITNVLMLSGNGHHNARQISIFKTADKS